MRKRLLAIAAALLAAITVTITVLVSSDDNGKPKVSVTIEVGGPHGTPTKTIEAPAAAVEAADATDIANHDGLRDETPPGAPDALLDQARDQQDALAETDQLPIVTPLAAPEQAGCKTRLVQNFSTRRGVRPRVFVLHYTASRNIAGWGDVDAIVALFDRRAFAASSNYVVDAEGHCAYIVRESDKAWTQAAFNPLAISVEVIGMGTEKRYLPADGLAKLGRVVSDATCRWEIPIQQGAIAGGTVAKPGIVDHRALGLAGGGHYDIAPYNPNEVIAAAKAARKAHRCGSAPEPKTVPKAKPSRPSTSTTAKACTTANIQRALNARGARLVVDGKTGPATIRATLRFQQGYGRWTTGPRKGAYKLTPDGLVGSQTGAALGLTGCGKRRG